MVEDEEQEKGEDIKHITFKFIIGHKLFYFIQAPSWSDKLLEVSQGKFGLNVQKDHKGIYVVFSKKVIS